MKGHFERGGEALYDGKPVDVEITKVLFFQKFDPKAKQPAVLKYLLIGDGAETFGVHLITGKPRPGVGGGPEFDHIINVSLSGDKLKKAVKETSSLLVDVPKKPNQKPLANDSIAEVFAPDEKVAGELQNVQSLYLEFGDLSH